MAFKLKSTLDGAGTVYRTFLLTDAEAASDGEVFKFSSGKLTKAGAQEVGKAVAMEAVGSGTGNTCDCILIRKDQVWKAPYSSSSSGVPGVGAAHRLDTDATGVDADETGGKFEILSVDTVKGICTGRFLEA